MLEKVVYNQVNTFLNDTHALNEQQYGFRKGRSRMSRGGCYGLINADWLISPPAAQILPGLLREREGKDGEDQRD